MKSFRNILAAAGLSAAVLAVQTPWPALSQAVTLVVVDVKAVAAGYRASKLTGTSVVNDKNEKIGSLDDIIIGRDKVLFAVLEVGGFLGIGAHMVVVPFNDLQLDETGKTITLPGASKDELKKLPEFKYG
ncbi:PRC-barrel domain containing protein (plasmid) [Azospirillum argentinense]|uniref:PRC-barrel domain containing protein n=2 Tax=Azospirillum TaxID=191 RepID=A0A4D8PZW2_AZOBR|nr:PRC-barrel domain containing protein [Azospirillum argentinense]